MQASAAIPRGTDIHIVECTTVEIAYFLGEDSGFVRDYIAGHYAILVNSTLHPDEIYAELDPGIRECAIPRIQGKNTDTSSTLCIKRPREMVANNFTAMSFRKP
jgi:hypothetical protein